MILDCLVIRQPYASLIIYGKKRWEFRAYDTAKRGLIGIIASPNKPLLTKNFLLNRYNSLFPTGVLLATAELSSSFYVTKADLKQNKTPALELIIHGKRFETADSPLGEPIEDIDFAINQNKWESYAWLFENIRPLDKWIIVEKLDRSTWKKMEVP